MAVALGAAGAPAAHCPAEHAARATRCDDDGGRLARDLDRKRARRPTGPDPDGADNGSGAFTRATVATTSADGSWSARLPAGPSRLVQAVYDGASTVEPTSSGQIRVIVPASVKLLSVSPNRVGWGGTVHIVGQLKGGYLPAAGTLVRLRIGSDQDTDTTYGVQEHVTGNGRFTTTYTFGAGIPGVLMTTLPVPILPRCRSATTPMHPPTAAASPCDRWWVS